VKESRASMAVLVETAGQHPGRRRCRQAQPRPQQPPRWPRMELRVETPSLVLFRGT
jgi:hypothetical protein